VPDEESDLAAEASVEEPIGLLKYLKHEFHDGGLTFECIYTGETFTKARGGIGAGRPTNYRSNLDLVGILNTGKMGWWDNGRLFVYGQNLSGRPLSPEEVGDVQLFSNLDSTINETERPHFTTIAEYWYEHALYDGDLRFKIGKQDANADFALTDLGGDFVHSSFGLPPMIPLPTFPSQALGIATFFHLTDTFVFAFGAFDGTLPSGPQGVRWGFDTLGRNGAITLYQLEWKPQFGPNEDFPSTVRLGMWHHNDKEVWVELTDAPDPRTFNQNYGVFLTADQMVWKESEGSDDDQGLGIFGQFGWAPGNRNVLGEYYGGGLVYKGLLPSRDSDLIGLGFASAMFGRGFQMQSAAQGDELARSETAVEMFYKHQYSPAISLQPDLQYIANPGGLYRDALLPGFRFEVIF
jgi:porin